MKRFVLEQDGIGVVCEGVQFSDGTVALRWMSSPTRAAVYNSIADVETVHSGTSTVSWRD